MMGSGKTEIGRCLAERFHLPFFDLDRLIESANGLSISNIFHNRGEEGFRALEHDMLSSIAGSAQSQVLSCGGGVVLDPENRTLLRTNYVVVWLDVPLDELIRRLSLSERSMRPLLAGQDWQNALAVKYQERTPLYREVAQVRYRWLKAVSPTESARIIQKLIEDYLRAVYYIS